ncbi:MAG: hypothetical protein NT118_05410 [Lentisphaerae bacterium]|nr:hypothetical protein [Lentisphaerota bacterium]
MGKYYFNGIDWIAAALNHQCRLTPAHGNNILIVLEFGAPFSSASKKRLLDACHSILPLLSGRIRRAWHLAPYWQPGNGSGVPFSENSVADDTGADAVIHAFANEPLPENTSVGIKLISINGGSRLIFKFSHLLFDGRGAELFLKSIDEENLETMAMHPGLPNPDLRKWADKFQAGKIVHRKRLAILEQHKIAALPSGQMAAMPAGFRIIRLDPADGGHPLSAILSINF